MLLFHCKCLFITALVHPLSARGTQSLDPATYEEPSAESYWSRQPDTGTVEIRRTAASLTREEFDRIILDGRVLVVEDAGKDWPMEDWTCDFFRTDPTFSKAEMNRQYAANPSGSGYVPFNSEWISAKASSGARDEDAPQNAPFYWGIKDVQYNDGPRSKTWKKSMLKKVREHVRLPAFMNAGNLQSFHRTPEFWFAGNGAGAKAHMDTHVETTMSLQLAGTKRWRLSLMEPRRSAYLTYIYTDGDVYEGQPGGWKPYFNITLKRGDALFFPPGFVHETMNVDDADACAASVTFQFNLPMPTRMYRRFLPRVRRTADIHEVWKLLGQWATLHRQGFKKGMPFEQAKKEALSSEEKTLAGHFRKVDADHDGSLSFAELQARFGQEEAVNLLGFHDLDEDNVITQHEFAEVFAFWAGTVHKVLEETPDKYKQYQLKDMDSMNIEDLPEKVQKAMMKTSLEAELKASTARTEL